MILLATLLASQWVGQEPDLARHECAVIVVASRPATSPSRPVFSATKILDVVFETHFRRRLFGPHVLSLQVETPKGHLYQVLTVPFTGRSPTDPPGERRAEHMRRVEGYPSPLKEEEMREEAPVDGRPRFAVSATLPVGGTWITTNSLFGEWTVQAFVDGLPASCGRGPTRFTITP